MRKRRTTRQRVSTQIVQQHIAEQIANSPREVFMRQDFEGLGSYEQVGRSLSRLTQQNKPIRIGQGLSRFLLSVANQFPDGVLKSWRRKPCNVLR